MRRQARALVAFMVAVLFCNASRAAQITPSGVEFANDTIEAGGELQACIITVGLVDPPAPEIVNFQFLVAFGQPAFKVTAADVNWSQQSSVAKRISDAEFYSGNFMHPGAFKKNITTEGQFVGVLTDSTLAADFLSAFLHGGFSVRFRRDDSDDDHTYYVEQGPGLSVAKTFQKCLDAMDGHGVAH
jgi:hypothetical protein